MSRDFIYTLTTIDATVIAIVDFKEKYYQFFVSLVNFLFKFQFFCSII